MLKSTFVHLKGIGKQSERRLWQKGLLTWEDYQNATSQNAGTLAGREPGYALRESAAAYLAGDIVFFSNCLPPAEYFRIALAYPQETLFLRVETTGLSLYYDQITTIGWSLGGRYGVYVYEQDEAFLRGVLDQAKAVVTFKGTALDLRFLRKTFPGISIPAIHLDLRYFARRIGLKGSLHDMAQAIGFSSKRRTERMLGDAAPVLWHRYRRGDKQALKRLIEYNHRDVEGMKAILDYAIEALYERESIPAKVRVNSRFSSKPSKIRWAKAGAPESDPYTLDLREFSGKAKPAVTFTDLAKQPPLPSPCIVGIDLVSSETRESGYCLLKGKHAETFRIKTDEEMISLAKKSGATLISIDSPLSIPEGRTSVFDHDPKRDECGITRHCERVLKRRGINSYPCLIPSMQKLTQRGMKLAEKYREAGIAVIESYPGAAQDIMGIPRKQAGLQYLADGLVEFGIAGSFTRAPVSHDELDAITAAIVGLFYRAGRYESLGNQKEGYLVIPEQNAEPPACSG